MLCPVIGQSRQSPKKLRSFLISPWAQWDVLFSFTIFFLEMIANPKYNSTTLGTDVSVNLPSRWRHGMFLAPYKVLLCSSHT